MSKQFQANIAHVQDLPLQIAQTLLAAETWQNIYMYQSMYTFGYKTLLFSIFVPNLYRVLPRISLQNTQKIPRTTFIASLLYSKARSLKDPLLFVCIFLMLTFQQKAWMCLHFLWCAALRTKIFQEKSESVGKFQQSAWKSRPEITANVKKRQVFSCIFHPCYL